MPYLLGMWSPTRRDEQQQMVDMLRSTLARGRKRRGQDRPDDQHERRVHCPGDFPRSPLTAEEAVEIIYQLEHEESLKHRSYEEVVGRLARAHKDERRRRVLEVYVLKEMKQAAYTANGRVASLAIGSGVMSPRAYVALETQLAEDWSHESSYDGFLGPEAQERAFARALPGAIADVDAFLSELGDDTGLYGIYDAIRNLCAPHYHKSYLEEFIADLQLEGDMVFERAAALSRDARWDGVIEGLYARLPEQTYRLVDLLTPEMLMADDDGGRFYRSSPSSLGELLDAIDREITELDKADDAKWEAVVLERRKASSPRYKQLLQEELARDGQAAPASGRLRRLLA